MKESIDNLEGPPPTLKDRAAMARELDKVAPTPADKFRLMLGQRPTPRTDEFMAATCCDLDHCADFARQLERELAEACGILDRALAQLPVGSLSAHKPDSVPERVGDVLKQLAEALEQRDRLAAALEACREDSCELLGERSWWKDEPRCNYSNRYDETVGNIVRADDALDSIKGGSCD